MRISVAGFEAAVCKSAALAGIIPSSTSKRPDVARPAEAKRSVQNPKFFDMRRILAKGE
jgi:hypothetical protein